MSVQLDVVGSAMHVVKPLHVCANAHIYWLHVVNCGAHFFKPLRAHVGAQVLICAVGQSEPARTLGLGLAPRRPENRERPFVLPLQPKVVSVQDREAEASGQSAGFHRP